jgi:hypothetical protein
VRPLHRWGRWLGGFPLAVFLLTSPVLGQEPAPTGPTGSVLKADVRVTLPPPGGSARVQLSYKLRPDPGSREVPVSLLAPDPAVLLFLRVFYGADEPGAAVDLRGVRDFYSEGEIPLPSTEGAVSDTVTLTFTYAVQRAWDRVDRAVIPLVVPTWVPDQPDPRTFEATIQPPPGYVVTSTFPTALGGTDPSDPTGSVSLSLQAVPAFMVIRVADAMEKGVTLEEWLDYLVLGLLAAMAFLGFLYLKRRSP